MMKKIDDDPLALIDAAMALAAALRKVGERGEHHAAPCRKADGLGSSWPNTESGRGGSASRGTIFAPPVLRVLIMVPLVVLEQSYERADRSRN
ncbi:hypothetical protein [Rhizobium leguminosarum]|uniref:hypothetical protein n=1 Tax=Rhizobium leguminosarum TaxID=384 RepID=UPI00161B6229|nr:hypothetical protein [Rhizobium leguminosarum]MBB4341389.1 hypothetical protein [Rhizobium leguminosarum]MBB6294013.1 hypothetical protein [Rhizobium leguminosarum]